MEAELQSRHGAAAGSSQQREGCMGVALLLRAAREGGLGATTQQREAVWGLHGACLEAA